MQEGVRLNCQPSNTILRQTANTPTPTHEMSDQFDVRYVAKLARLDLSDAEIAKFQSQLGSVLAHVEQFGKVDVSNVQATAHANPVINVFRADESHDTFTPETALSNAPRAAGGLFVVPKVIE